MPSLGQLVLNGELHAEINRRTRLSYRDAIWRASGCLMAPFLIISAGTKPTGYSDLQVILSVLPLLVACLPALTANFLFAKNLKSHLLLVLQNGVETETSIKLLKGSSKQAEIQTLLPTINKSDSKLKFTEVSREQRDLFDGNIKHCNTVLDENGLPLAICTARTWLITNHALPKVWWLKTKLANGKQATNWPLILTMLSILMVVKLFIFR